MTDWSIEVELISLREGYDALAKELCPSHGERYHSLEPCKVRQVLAEAAVKRERAAVEMFAPEEG